MLLARCFRNRQLWAQSFKFFAPVFATKPSHVLNGRHCRTPTLLVKTSYASSWILKIHFDTLIFFSLLSRLCRKRSELELNRLSLLLLLPWRCQISSSQDRQQQLPILNSERKKITFRCSVHRFYNVVFYTVRTSLYHQTYEPKQEILQLVLETINSLLYPLLESFLLRWIQFLDHPMRSRDCLFWRAHIFYQFRKRKVQPHAQRGGNKREA